MSDQSNQYIPPEPINMPIIQLDKGMVRHLPSTLIPPGAVITAKNMHIIDGCLKRRPGVDKFAVGTGGTHLNMDYAAQGSCLLWKTDGTAVTVIWDQKQIYIFSSPFFGVKSWYYATGTVTGTIATSTVTGTGTTWLSAVQWLGSGDIFSTSVNAQKYIITAIPLTNQLTVTPPLTAGLAGATYKIKRAFRAAAPYYFVDWCVVDNKMVLADGGRPLYSFDGGSLTNYLATTYVWKAQCVAYFANRVWAANTSADPMGGGSGDYILRSSTEQVQTHNGWIFRTPKGKLRNCSPSEICLQFTSMMRSIWECPPTYRDFPLVHPGLKQVGSDL
jgi:hypothetical protein